MKKNVIAILAMAVVGAMLFGCAAKGPQPTPAPFSAPSFDPGQYDPKVDNFMVILDASSSMDSKYNGIKKFVTAKTVVDRLNQSLPEIGYTGYLRSFGPYDSKTNLLYGPERYSTDAFGAALSGAAGPGGNTPLGRSIDDTGADLSQIGGPGVKTAVIVVSDGKEPLDNPAGSAAKLKAENPDACFYTVLVGDDPGGKALMDNIAKTGECGYALDAENLYTTAGMAEFVNDVFLAKKPPPPPVVVPTPGPCPDSDRDGVCDDEDRCPGTPYGVRADTFGCWVLGEVLFDFDKAVIKQEAHPLLNEVQDILMKNPGLTVLFEGHTDSVGPEAYNQNLSERRAKAVMKYLLDKGVPSAQMSMIGFGETRPRSDNTTKEGRALNRRVEITPQQ